MPGQAFRSDNMLVSVIDFGPEATGLIVHSELHRGGGGGNTVRIEGELGTLVFPLWGNTVNLRSDRVGPDVVEVSAGSEDFRSSFCGPMADFLIHLEQGLEPTVSGRRNLPPLQQVFAEHQSAQQGGAWVPL